MPSTSRFVSTAVLEIGYRESGAPGAPAVILLHGFPYDVHAFDDVARELNETGLRTIVPYLRGFGPTRYLHPKTLRSGQQGALGDDLRRFMDALGIERAVLGGYDWGGRAACIVAALYPERVRGLVTGEGYNVQNLAAANEPLAPAAESELWYQYYFHSARGRAALERRRDDLCAFLWRTWSPAWDFDEATFAKSARAFANPDFVATVVHSYRHRFNLVPGDPAYDAIEEALAKQPPIGVPTISLVGTANGLAHANVKPDGAEHFSGAFEERRLAGAGHNLPQEAPQAFARAIRDLV